MIQLKISSRMIAQRSLLLLLLFSFLGLALCPLRKPRVLSTYYSNRGAIELSRALLSGLKPVIGTTTDSQPYTYDSIQGIRIAETYFVAALSWDANSARAYHNLGQIHLVGADFGKASDLFKKSISLNPDNVLAYWHLGGIYEAQGEHEKAVEAWAKAGI
jgi:tetratricopeptide (TPR) repeat protein